MLMLLACVSIEQGAGASAPSRPQLLPLAATAIKPSPCQHPTARAFDFWLGEWEVESKGKVHASSSITLAQDGCVIHEYYRVPSTGYNGQSINSFDRARSLWHQTWADNSGMLLLLEGGIKDGAMVLEGTRQLRVGEASISQREKITWTPKADGTVRQHWQTKQADGAWKTTFDGTYRRRHEAG
jgi:hypothetical protein